MLSVHRKTALASRSLFFSTSRVFSTEVVNASSSSAPPVPPPVSSSAPTPTPSPVTDSANEPTETNAEDSKRVANPKHKRRYPTRRPRISLDHPRQWHRPLRAGFLPAYDEALKVIHRDSWALKQEAYALRRRIERMESNLDSVDHKQIAEDKNKLEILEVQSEINLPSIRWKFANAMGEFCYLVVIFPRVLN